MRRKRLDGYMCRAGRVFEVQTRSNGAEKVKVLLRTGCDGTIVPIKKLDVFWWREPEHEKDTCCTRMVSNKEGTEMPDARTTSEKLVEPNCGDKLGSIVIIEWLLSKGWGLRTYCGWGNAWISRVVYRCGSVNKRNWFRLEGAMGIDEDDFRVGDFGAISAITW